MRRIIFLDLLLFFFLAGLSPSALSQATSGTILGRVTDTSGAVIVGAQVAATNEATGIVQDTKTEDTGYFLRSLVPGSYTLKVTKEGFKQASRKGIPLLIDQQLSVDFQLTAGSTSETVVVTSELPLLQTESAETGEVIQTKQILDLPLLGRNFLDLARLTSGVASGGGGNTLNLAVNGEREFANSVLIDGVEATANRNNDTGLRPSVDAVQEFKVSTSDYAAEFGRAAGGVVSIQTKAGENRWHGSLYEFYRPSATAAENYAFPTQTGRPSQLSQHNYGGTFGGPIVKNKIFFFLSYEGQKQSNPISYVDSVPPTNQIVFDANGDVDLSGLKDPLTGNQIPIFDPNITYQNYGYYAQQFPGNIIPASEVSVAGKNILQNFFPSPNLPGTYNGWYSNFQVNAPYHYDGRNGDTRIDYTISSRDTLTGAYHYSDFNSMTGDPFWGAIPVQGGGDADQGDVEDSRNQQTSITETHVINGRMLNEFRFGYTRFRLNQTSLLNGRDLANQFDVGNINIPGVPATSGFPYIYLGTGYITGGSTYKPLYFTDSNYQYSDSLTIQRGGHGIKVGAEYRRLNANPVFSLFPTGFQYYTGPYQYAPNGPQTSDPTYAYFYDPSAAFPNGGSDVADLLTGVPTTVNMGLQLTTPHTQSWELSFYGQDTWKVTPRLTLNLGVRYEFMNPYTEVRNQLSNYDPVSGLILIGGRGGNSDALINARKNNFSPRVGFAFRAMPKMVLRAGFGLFYTPENDARSDVLTKNYPFGVQQKFVNNIFNGPPYTYYLDTGLPRSTTIPVGSGVSSIDPATITDPNTGAQDANLQTVYSVDPNMKTGYSEMFNLTIQQELTPSLTMEVGYVGTRSHQLPYAIGNIVVGTAAPDQLGQIERQAGLGWAQYNSFQTKLTKRLTANLSFLGAYTWSHNIDNGPAPFNLGHNLNSHNQPQDPFNLNLEIASADDDVRNNFVFSSLYQLPFGHGQKFHGDMHGAEQAVLGGWQFNGIFNARSGLPLNVVRNGNLTACPGVRPNLVGDPNLGSGRTLDHYFNTAAFSNAGLSGCALGTAGRNVVLGPGFVNTDFSVFKNLAIRESMDLQLRFEFFNLLNTPHFASPGSDASVASNFGRITQTSANSRIVQFAAKFRF
jgi:hypothetical protein